jgi:hypothetical protein
MPRRTIARWLVAGALALLVAAPAHAEVLRVEPGLYSVMAQPSLPMRGQHQSQVVARHGQPLQRFATVGGDRPLHPPITRWDYDGFSVVFEGPLVLHSVVHGPHTPQPR